MKAVQSAQVKVLLVDDHPLLRASLRDYLSRYSSRYGVVAEAGSSDTAWQAVVQHEPELIVMDVGIPGEDGVALTRRIRGEYPGTVILILTANVDAQKINGALDAGASGYVLKSCTSEEFLAAVDAVVAGQIYLSPAASTVIVKELQRQRRGGNDGVLTAKELETLRQIANGLTTKEIAFAMRISTKTVETHRANLMSKLRIGTVAGLTKYALRHGLTNL
ncbi:MAG: response regulator transcription factor [Opitutaceae bacterium]